MSGDVVERLAEMLAGLSEAEREALYARLSVPRQRRREIPADPVELPPARSHAVIDWA